MLIPVVTQLPGTTTSLWNVSLRSLGYRITMIYFRGLGTFVRLFPSLEFMHS